TREQLGGLSHTVGYVLEDRAYKSLPKLLKEDFGVEVEGGLKRDYMEVGRNRYEEINIIGKGKKDGREVLILGEAKTQLKKSDIDSFMEKINRLKAHLGYGEKILVFVTYQASPPVREYAKQKGVAVYFSYQFDL
ncbi:MAG: chordopoxvirus fusion protein, partial [Aquificaceae bacterium]